MKKKLLVTLIVITLAGAICYGDSCKKTKSIIIDHIQFENAPIANVISFLRKKTIKIDPAGKGINFLLQVKKEDAAKHKVTLELDKVPLKDVIRYVCLSANLGYRFEENSVIIASKSYINEKMVTRVFKAHPMTIRTVNKIVGKKSK